MILNNDMTFLISITMIIILIVINIALIFFVISLNIQFYKEKELYKSKSELLKNEVFDVSKKHSLLANKLELSNNLDIKMQQSNASLNKKIYGLYYYFCLLYTSRCV